MIDTEIAENNLSVPHYTRDGTVSSIKDKQGSVAIGHGCT